jgi:excisionase family DNA binding protein
MTKGLWVKTSEACEFLEISQSTLYRWIKRKILKKGVHYRDFGTGLSRRYQWNIKNIEKLLSLR